MNPKSYSSIKQEMAVTKSRGELLRKVADAFFASRRARQNPALILDLEKIKTKGK